MAIETKETPQRFSVHHEITGWVVFDQDAKETVLVFPVLGPYGIEEHIGNRYARQAAGALNKAVASYTGPDDKPKVRLLPLGTNDIEDLGEPLKGPGDIE